MLHAPAGPPGWASRTARSARVDPAGGHVMVHDRPQVTGYASRPTGAAAPSPRQVPQEGPSQAAATSPRPTFGNALEASRPPAGGPFQGGHDGAAQTRARVDLGGPVSGPDLTQEVMPPATAVHQHPRSSCSASRPGLPHLLGQLLIRARGTALLGTIGMHQVRHPGPRAGTAT